MAHSRLYIGALSPLAGAGYSLFFIAVFLLAMVCEVAFESGGGPQAHAITCAGVLIGALNVCHRKYWIWLFSIAFALRFGFELFQNWSAPLYALGQACIVIGCTGVMLLVARSWRIYREKDRYTTEILLPMAVGVAPASLLYGFLSALSDPDVSWSAVSVATSCLSFFVGIAIISPLIICLALPLGGPPKYSAGRMIDNILASALFLFGVSVGFNEALKTVIATTGIQFSLIWLAIPFLIWLAVRSIAVVVAANLFAMFLIASAGWQLELGYFNDASSPALLLQWQATVSGMALVAISCTALMSSLRFVGRVQRLNTKITRSLLTDPKMPVDGIDGKGPTGVGEVMGDVARFGGALECRLYTFEQAGNYAMLGPHWRNPSLQPESLEKRISLNRLERFVARLEKGGVIRLRHDDRTGKPVPEVFDALQIPANRELLFVPARVDQKVTGMIGLISDSDKSVAERDIVPMLKMIGDSLAVQYARQQSQAVLLKFERRLRELAARLTESDERIRRHTSVKLHDGLIQQLAVARMKLGELRYRRVTSPNTVDKITGIIDETLSTTRRIVQQLSPSVLYELGLVPGLENLCDQVSLTGPMAAELEEHGQRQRLPEALMVAMYEVVRELISNARQHSNGSHIWVDIDWSDSGLERIRVSDDGNKQTWWIDNENEDGDTGLGLLSISERLRSFGYAVSFDTRDGGGTEAMITASSRPT